MFSGPRMVNTINVKIANNEGRQYDNLAGLKRLTFLTLTKSDLSEYCYIFDSYY